MDVVGFSKMRPVVRMPCSSRPPRPWTSVVVAIGGLTLAGPAGSDPINDAAAVVGDQQRPILIHGHGDRVLADYTAELGRGRPRRLAPSTIARRLAAVRSLLRFTLGAARVPDAVAGP